MPMQFFVAGCLAALLAPSQFQEQRQVAGKQFDLRHLTLSMPRHITGEVQAALLPLMRTSRPVEFGEREDTEPIDRLVDMFLTAHEGELEAVESLNNGVLYMESTPNVLAEFQDLVDGFTAVLASRPTLEIVSVTFPKGVKPELPAKGSVSKARVQTWAESGATFARRYVRANEFGYQRTANLQAHTVFAGVGVEIAQASAAVQPNVFDVATGSDLVFAAHRVGDAVEITYTLRRTERHEADSTAGATAQLRLFHESGRTETLDQERWLEPFGVTGGAVCGQGRISPGEYMALSVGGVQGQAHCTLIGVVPGSNPKPPVHRLMSTEDGTAILFPASYVVPPRTEIHWSGDRLASLLEHWATDALEGQEWHMLAAAGLSDESILQRRMESLDTWEEFELADQRCIILPTADAGRVERWIQAAAAQPVEQYNVSVRAQDGRGRQHRSGGLTLMNGTQGALVAGQERLVAKGVAVEVAQNVATRTPITRLHFEGLALAIEVSGTSNGALGYRLSGQLLTDLDVRTSTVNETTDSDLQALSVHQLLIDESGIAPASSSGTWNILVGDSTLQGAFVELTVSRR